jgi:ATP-dependent Clp protease adaptor protein ClpS
MKLQTRAAPVGLPAKETETELEPLYRVIIHNDEVTPMDFVVHVLKSIFQLDEPQAIGVMFDAHHNGAAVVQFLPRSEAEKRIGRAHFAAGLEGYPLRFTMEEE